LNLASIIINLLLDALVGLHELLVWYSSKLIKRSENYV